MYVVRTNPNDEGLPYSSFEQVKGFLQALVNECIYLDYLEIKKIEEKEESHYFDYDNPLRFHF